MIEPAIRSILVSDDAVKALVSDRVYFQIAPENLHEAFIVLQTVSDVPLVQLSAPANWSNGRVQVSCFASTYRGARLLADAVRIALDGFGGAAPDGTDVGLIDANRGIDLPIELADGQETPQVYGVAVDAEYGAAL